MSALKTGYGFSPVHMNGIWHQDDVLSSYQKLTEQCPASSLSSGFRRVTILAKERQVKRIAFLILFNVTSVFILLSCCRSTQSMALQAYMYTIGFNLLSLMICILPVWVELNGPTPLFSFGYERFEVLAILASTVLAQLGSLFIAKESFERLVLDQPVIHTGRLMIGTGLAFFSHIVDIYGCRNAALDHVIAASSSSWLQEHVSDISQSICSVVPVLTGLLLPRINPMLLVACVGAVALFLTDLLIQLKNCYTIDTLVAIFIAAVTFATMLPMSIYSGKILLQTTPSHIVGQLDRCLRETLTIDGILEFRNEHFWTLSFGKMAGSLQVRIRRDADEQLVLAHVVDRLSNLVSVLTVQVFKDEWTMRASSISAAIPQSSAPLLPSNTSDSVNLPKSSENLVGSIGPPNFTSTGNFLGQNGISFPYRNVVPFSSVQSNAFPIITSTYSKTNIEPSQTFQHVPGSHISATEFKEQSLRTSGKYPLAESSWNSPAQHKDSFLPSFPVSPVQQPLKNNLLISGTRTLEANRFVYQPR